MRRYPHHQPSKSNSKKPVIRVYKDVLGRYEYFHMKNDLKPIIASERMGFGGFGIWINFI